MSNQDSSSSSQGGSWYPGATPLHTGSLSNFTNPFAETTGLGEPLDIGQVDNALEALQKMEDEINASQGLRTPALLRSDYCYSAPLPVEQEYLNGEESAEMKRSNSAHAQLQQMQQQQFFDFVLSQDHQEQSRPGTAPPVMPNQMEDGQYNGLQPSASLGNLFDMPSPSEPVKRPMSAYPTLEHGASMQSHQSAAIQQHLRPALPNFPSYYMQTPTSA